MRSSSGFIEGTGSLYVLALTGGQAEQYGIQLILAECFYIAEQCEQAERMDIINIICATNL